MRPVATIWGLGAGLVLALGLSNVGWAAEPQPPAEPGAGTEPAPGPSGAEPAPGEGGGPGAGGEAPVPPKPPEGAGPGEPGAGAEGGAGAKPEGAGASGPSRPAEPAGGREGSTGGATQVQAATAKGAPGADANAGAKVEKPEAGAHRGSFEFGSYGRVAAATDGLGRAARDADIVAHGSRFDLFNYAEIELRREDHWAEFDAHTRIVTTLAFGHPMFHWSGEFDGALAIRNLFVEERDLGAKGVSVWAGSRMLRGDDIYLLDFWPLDNLNTIGGGFRYGVCGDSVPAAVPAAADADAEAEGQGAAASDDAADKAASAAPTELPPPWCTAVSGHFGFAQPTNPFYRQEVSRPVSLNQFGAATVAVLDRQRWVGSLRGEQIVRFGGTAGLKLVGYGELHGVPDAQRQAPNQPEVYEDLPSDVGWVLGAQVGLFSGERDTHLNLFFRYAGGLPAYGDFATPTSLGLDLSATDAHELLLALGGNWEIGPVALTLGSYFRSFRNANGELDFEDLDEGIVLLRPHLFFVDWAGVALEGSYQVQQRGVITAGLEDPTQGQDFEPLVASVGRIGVIPFISPAGAGTFKRPWIFLSYMASFRNDGARELYPESDPFRLHDIEHQVAIGAEWWFSSTSYGGQ